MYLCNLRQWKHHASLSRGKQLPASKCPPLYSRPRLEVTDARLISLHISMPQVASNPDLAKSRSLVHRFQALRASWVLHLDKVSCHAKMVVKVLVRHETPGHLNRETKPGAG